MLACNKCLDLVTSCGRDVWAIPSSPAPSRLRGAAPGEEEGYQFEFCFDSLMNERDRNQILELTQVGPYNKTPHPHADMQLQELHSQDKGEPEVDQPSHEFAI